MPSSRHPFKIPELAQECLGYLHDTSDIAACATVNRSWRHAAQPRLFRDIGFTFDHSDQRCAQFLDIISVSPHLTQYVVRLEVWVTKLSLENLAALVKLQFPKVRTLCISAGNDSKLSPPVADGIQQLLGLPRLRSVELTCMYDDPRLFLHIWARAPASIRHVSLSRPNFPCSEEGLPDPDPDLNRTVIPIESLSLTGNEGIPCWLRASHSPFDFTHLKALYFHDSQRIIELLREPVLAAAAASIELLEVDSPQPVGSTWVSPLPIYMLNRNAHFMFSSAKGN